MSQPSPSRHTYITRGAAAAASVDRRRDTVVARTCRCRCNTQTQKNVQLYRRADTRLSPILTLTITHTLTYELMPNIRAEHLPSTVLEC